ncbi:MAG: CDP-alcohol phosphatidyltransferase family protein [Acidimicrobiia bacterium]
MLDLKGRKKVAPVLKPIAAFLARLRLTPTVVTILGLVITVVGATLIAAGRLSLGAATAGFGTLLDALDGPLARLQGTATNRGAFLDTISDRFGEIAIWIGIAVFVRGDQRLLVLCIIGLVLSLLVPYIRAHAQVLGLEGKGGWMGRAERMIFILTGVGLVGFGLALEPILWVFVALTGFTVAQRIWKTWQQLGS